MARVLSFDLADPEEAVFTDKVEYTRRYLARVDDLQGAPRALYNHDRRLQRGQPHPEDPIARVKEFRPTQIPGKSRSRNYLFEIEVRWDSDVEARQNPLLQPAEIEWSTTEITRVVTIDREGRPIVNTAGSLLTDLQEELSLWVIDVQKNVPAVPAWFASYANAVNAEAFKVDGFTAPARTLKLKTVKLGARQYDEDFRVSYRALQFQLIYTQETWDRRVLNRGLYELQLRRLPSGRQVTDQVRIHNENGEPIEEPAFLDERGRRPRRPLRDPETGQPYPTLSGSLRLTELKPPPLDPADIIVLRFETAKKLPFRVLPVA